MPHVPIEHSAGSLKSNDSRLLLHTIILPTHQAGTSDSNSDTEVKQNFRRFMKFILVVSLNQYSPKNLQPSHEESITDRNFLFYSCMYTQNTNFFEYHLNDPSPVSSTVVAWSSPLIVWRGFEFITAKISKTYFLGMQVSSVLSFLKRMLIYVHAQLQLP
jgi:hypothetical protein